MKFKSQYTKEETEEIIAWFRNHEYENDLYLDKSQHITDLKKCLAQFTHLASTQYGNPNFAGIIYNLFRIKEELIKQGKVKSSDKETGK